MQFSPLTSHHSCHSRGNGLFSFSSQPCFYTLEHIPFCLLFWLNRLNLSGISSQVVFPGLRSLGKAWPLHQSRLSPSTAPRLDAAPQLTPHQRQNPRSGPVLPPACTFSQWTVHNCLLARTYSIFCCSQLPTGEEWAQMLRERPPSPPPLRQPGRPGETGPRHFQAAGGWAR